MEKVCFYHSIDLDGWTSAAIVKMKFPEARLIGWNHGDPNPSKEDFKDCITFVVDICPPNMKEIIEHSLKTIWIDHHKSSIDSMKRIMDSTSMQKLEHNVDTRYAACELTYQYLFDGIIPEPVTYLGLYDSFRHKTMSQITQLNTLYFQYYARSICSSPEEAKTFILTTEKDPNRADFAIGGIKIGMHIYRYECEMAKQTYKTGFEIEFDDLKFIAFSKERFNPAVFGINYHEDGYDGAACYWDDRKAGVRRWSLYSDNGKTDVSEICKRRGGGGHFGAAGFQEKIEIWEKK